MIVRTKLTDTERSGFNQTPIEDTDFQWTNLESGMYIIDGALLVVSSVVNKSLACTIVPSITPEIPSFISGHALTPSSTSSMLRPITNPMASTGTQNSMLLANGTNTVIKLTGILFAPETIDVSFYWGAFGASGAITMRAGSTISLEGPF